jgi:hypothetical protein
MQNASNTSEGSLVKCLERIEVLLAEAITLARSGPRDAKAKSSRPRAAPRVSTVTRMDFSSNIRAFVKRYAGEMSGQQKFALLLAYLTKGDPSKRIALEEILGHWNKMTAKGLLGMKFNHFYTSAAKENDWVSTEKSGLYYLRPSWKEIFNDND